MIKPVVSIIVPVYNVEQYLEKCVDSLVRQTLTQIEILLVDDGSTDGSGAMVDRLAKTDPRIKAFHKPNGGLSDARNFALPHVQGEYIGFVDSDDWVDETMFAKLYNKAKATGAECVVCEGLKCPNGGDPEGLVNIRAPASAFGMAVKHSPIIPYASQSYAWNKLYHKKLFSNPKMHFPVGQLFEDSAVVYNLLAEANMVASVHEPLYYYRTARAGAITSSISPKIFDIFKSCRSIIAYYSAKGLIDGETPYHIEKIVRNHLIARFDLLLTSKERLLAFRYVRRTFRFLDTRFPGWRERYPTPEKKKKSWLFACRKSRAAAYAWILTPKFAFKLFDFVTEFGFGKRPKVNVIPNDKLRNLQLELVEILDQFDDLCKAHNLRYYLSEGTLLGAVRHSGFIPWDDDLDVAMPRKDYEQLLALPADAWPQAIRLWSHTTDPRYPLPFSKVVTTSPSDFRNCWPKDIPSRFSGPFVDVFPLDKVTEHKAEDRTEVQLRIRKTRDILLIKRGYSMQRTGRNRFLTLISPFYSYKRLHRMLRDDSTLLSPSIYSTYICNLASSYHPSKQTVPAGWYGRPKNVMFEGKMRPCPSRYTGVLTKIYGKWNEMPPVWKRGRHTHFMSYEPNAEAPQTTARASATAAQKPVAESLPEPSRQSPAPKTPKTAPKPVSKAAPKPARKPVQKPAPKPTPKPAPKRSTSRNRKAD